MELQAAKPPIAVNDIDFDLPVSNCLAKSLNEFKNQNTGNFKIKKLQPKPKKKEDPVAASDFTWSKFQRQFG